MTLEQAKEFIAAHTNPSAMTKADIDKYKQALNIIAGSWAVS